MKVGDIKRLPKVKGNGYFIVKVVGLNTNDGVQYAEVVPVDFKGNIRKVKADRLLDLMTREDAKKTLKENLCAMCSYGSQNMDSCDIKSCDNKDAIKTLDQETCKDSVSRKAILSKIKEVCFSDKWLQFRVNKGSHGQRDFIIDYIEKLPPVTPERKKGKWLKQYMAFVNDDNQIVTECHCTNCYGISYFRSMNGELVGAKYCPSCGAEMTAEENDK